MEPIFDDYFPYRKKKCELEHVQRWLNLFSTSTTMK